MKISNPQKVKKAEIVVGIPSYNEAETIGFVVEQVSQGLEKFFPDKKSVIINLDHESPDGTREAFFNAQSEINRMYISTGQNVKGKGRNFYNLFSIVQKLKARVVIVVDADLRSIRPIWIRRMARPVLEEGYQFVAPYYIRCKTDATITNQLVYPLVYGLLAWDVRQPIGGDFAFSDKMVDYWLRQKWEETTYQFGIDIFMSLSAYLKGAKTCQVNLGSKLHNLSNPKLGPMFFQVTETLFKLILENLDRIEKETQIKEIPLFGGKELPILANANPDQELFRGSFWEQLDRQWDLIVKIVSPSVKKELEKIRSKKDGLFNLELWTKIVYDFLYGYKVNRYAPSVIEALGCLYFGQVASFFKENEHLTPEQAEKEVVKRAKYFFKERDYFFNKLEQ